VTLRDETEWRWFLQSGRLEAARAFLEGRYDVEGNLMEAVQFKQAQTGRAERLWAWLAAHDPQRWRQSRRRAAESIRFHYDRSNDFYRLFLDEQMVYSCAYWESPQVSLDAAQAAKLDLICRKLNIQPGDSFLDIGCGWGALVRHAARQYGARAEGCTLSPSQQQYAIGRAGSEGLQERVQVRLQDYRELSGRYPRIASVGMFEHVGRRRLPIYFRRVHALLQEGGLFLNHGIIRPQGVTDDAETFYLQHEIFPGGELTSLSEVIRIAEEAGFEVLDVENLRPHYALTCQAWVRRLQERAAECRALVGERTWRAWLLYLAGSAANFDSGHTDIHQILMARRGSRTQRPLHRAAMYHREDTGAATRPRRRVEV
jgi:cyclopropane-fatty-acyl-phospholipid synthase